MTSLLKPPKFSQAWQETQTGEQLLKLFEPHARLDRNAQGFADTNKFVTDLKKLLMWLDKCHKEEHDQAFTSWLIKKLKTTQGIMQCGFVPAFSTDVK
ncbi:hypothetical protein BGX26_008086, partial [Mortierella sp. AD094]